MFSVKEGMRNRMYLLKGKESNLSWSWFFHNEKKNTGQNNMDTESCRRFVEKELWGISEWY